MPSGPACAPRKGSIGERRPLPGTDEFGPASGQGKTLVTAALARRHRIAGRRVRIFKCRPDFLDPMILEQASGVPARGMALVIWM